MQKMHRSPSPRTPFSEIQPLLGFACPSDARKRRRVGFLGFLPKRYHNPHEACTMRTVLIPHMEELLQKITDLQSAVNTGKDSL